MERRIWNYLVIHFSQAAAAASAAEADAPRYDLSLGRLIWTVWIVRNSFSLLAAQLQSRVFKRHFTLFNGNVIIIRPKPFKIECQWYLSSRRSKKRACFSTATFIVKSCLVTHRRFFSSLTRAKFVEQTQWNRAIFSNHKLAAIFTRSST